MENQIKMTLSKALKIRNMIDATAEYPTREEDIAARKFLIKKGLMRIVDKKYQIQAKCCKFLTAVKEDKEEWVFDGFWSPYDGIELNA